MSLQNNEKDARDICCVLASSSPRRRDLMTQAGFRFVILPSTGEEKAPDLSPRETVRLLSGQKAREVAERIRGGASDPDGGYPLKTFAKRIIIGADTVVSLDGTILGKPKDPAEARRMLRALSGRTHEVYTGVTVIEQTAQNEADREVSLVERTEVDFMPVTDEEIDRYLLTGESFDKAGAYGIQGSFAIHVRGIRGDFYNVIGLPIAALYQMLKENKML